VQGKELLVFTMKNSIAEKERKLELMCPNNPYSEEFLEDKELGARRATIDLLKEHIYELKRYLNAVERVL
jgi:hypothetical protein